MTHGGERQTLSMFPLKLCEDIQGFLEWDPLNQPKRATANALYSFPIFSAVFAKYLVSQLNIIKNEKLYIDFYMCFPQLRTYMLVQSNKTFKGLSGSEKRLSNSRLGNFEFMEVAYLQTPLSIMYHIVLKQYSHTVLQ